MLKYSSAHAAATLRRTERARASAESNDATRGRRCSVMTDISLRPLEWPGQRGHHCADLARIGHSGLHLCHLALPATCCTRFTRPEGPYTRAPYVR